MALYRSQNWHYMIIDVISTCFYTHTSSTLWTFNTTVNSVLSGHSKLDKTKIIMTNVSLMKVESIAECSPWSILQCFWPALSDNQSWKSIFGLFESGCFRQVLLYMNFWFTMSIKWHNFIINMDWKQCGSWSAGFWWSQLILGYTVFKRGYRFLIVMHSALRTGPIAQSVESDCRFRSCEFDLTWSYTFMEIDQEIISTVIPLLLLIQEGLLSVTGARSTG